MNFGDMTFSGGIQNFGGTNTNTQNNYYDLTPREQIDAQLSALRAAYPDPAMADREIVTIERGIRQPSVEGRREVDGALKRLADNSNNARTATEAIAAIAALVAAHWPF
jgi:hypothetical protein